MSAGTFATYGKHIYCLGLGTEMLLAIVFAEKRFGARSLGNVIFPVKKIYMFENCVELGADLDIFCQYLFYTKNILCRNLSFTVF